VRLKIGGLLVRHEFVLSLIKKLLSLLSSGWFQEKILSMVITSRTINVIVNQSSSLVFPTGYVDLAMKTALGLREYEDVLNPEDIYSLLGT